MKKLLGFSLIEISIAIVIIGILSAFCFPLFFQHVTQEKRMEAATMLSKVSIALEQYYGMNNTYQNASLSTLGFSDVLPNHAYQLAIVDATDSHYEIRAIPIDDQAKKDKECGTLSLNSMGEKNISGSGKLEHCW
jgi:type IV pilus assembly protein PilE